MNHSTLPVRPVRATASRRTFRVRAAFLSLLLTTVSTLIAHNANSETIIPATPSAPSAITLLTPYQRDLAIATLRAAVRDQPQWIKIHAAEFLLDVNLPEGVGDHFLEEIALHGTEPQYRIGIWRVLSRCPSTPAIRAKYLDKITDAAFDPDGPDRLHAIEALAKLNVPLGRNEQQQIKQWISRANVAEAPLGHWLLALQPDSIDRQSELKALLKLVAEGEGLPRLRAAYALERIPLSEQCGEDFIELAHSAIGVAPAQNSLQQLADAQLIASGWSVAQSECDAAGVERFRSELQLLAANSDAVNRLFVEHLARLGGIGDLDRLTALLTATDPDLASSAAHALLSIEQRLLAERD